MIVGPKDEVQQGRGTQYHAVEKLIELGESKWVYEELEIALVPTKMLLVRVLIGKVANMDRLKIALRATPVVQGDQMWNCVMWVKNALEVLQAEGGALGTCELGWTTVRDAAMAYCQEKRDQHRFDGSGNFDLSRAPTYSLLEGRETIA